MNGCEDQDHPFASIGAVAVAHAVPALAQEQHRQGRNQLSESVHDHSSTIRRCITIVLNHSGTHFLVTVLSDALVVQVGKKANLAESVWQRSFRFSWYAKQ
jgi:hypothetical protein